MTEQPVPIRKYGEIHGLSAKELLQKARDGHVKIVSHLGQQCVIEAPEKPVSDQAKEPSIEEMIEAEKEPSENFSTTLKGALWLAARLTLPIFILYVVAAAYALKDINHNINYAESVSELDRVDFANIISSIQAQLTLDTSLPVPATEQEQLDLVVKKFKMAKLRNDLSSLSGIRSIVALGTGSRYVPTARAGNFLRHYDGFKVTGLNSYQISLQNQDGDPPVHLYFQRYGVTWYLVDMLIE